MSTASARAFPDPETNSFGSSLLWPSKPDPLPVGYGSREDRRRMAQAMRAHWTQANGERGTQVREELTSAQSRQGDATAFWDAHKTTVKALWANRSGGRGKTVVADIHPVAQQWDRGNPSSPEAVSATAQNPGVQSPYRWRCPLFPDDHPTWPAWPKDRVLAGAGCPACRKLTRLADLPTLAAQYRGDQSLEDVAYGSHDHVPWLCRTWAADPLTGLWRKVEHRFTAEVKSRALQQDSCLVCAGFLVDDTSSLQTWFPELAEQLDDPGLDPATMPTTMHNATGQSRTPGHRTYATVWWRCRRGHRWQATVLNRVQGADCGQCSTSGISKEQVRLVAELAELFVLAPAQRPDPRLPDGVRDFASHRLAVAPEFKPAHWRYQDVEVDAVLHLPGLKVVVGVEYDGSYHHSSAVREGAGRRDEQQKSEVLASAGLLDLLVHVRVGELEPLEGEHLLSVSVAERSGPFEQASAVARALRERYAAHWPWLDDYLSAGVGIGQHQADAYITEVWGQLAAPRAKRPQAEPKERALRATAPHPSSWLAPVSEPYRRPGKPREIVRDYQCRRCGDDEMVTAVQSQVTYGTRTSCGCLKEETSRRKRPVISHKETQAVRVWATGRGHEIAGMGRVADRYVASYRLDDAGRCDLLGEDGLLAETAVADWARQEGRALGVRNRVTSELWLDYAHHHLTTAADTSEAGGAEFH
ncbi:zinc-ribbon domain-containing protein [Kitasatospora sp. NPDC101183]|uniref:zinc-ribbon domain-containing protein n=1 Tax=Kitasatospora sp. NPDC101183 TaxID=3364100 RepID=UPI0038038DF8